MPLPDAVQTVLDWHAALNHDNHARVLALSSPDIELVGPRGSAHGHAVLQSWLQQAGLKLQVLQVFHQGNTVVVAQHGIWQKEGQVVGEAEVASVFQVEEGKVSFLSRLDNLQDALEQGRLTVHHQIGL